MSSNHTRKLGKATDEPFIRRAPNRFTRPIWIEPAVVGFAAMFAVVAGGLLFVRQLELSPVLYNLILK